MTSRTRDFRISENVRISCLVKGFHSFLEWIYGWLWNQMCNATQNFNWKKVVSSGVSFFLRTFQQVVWEVVEKLCYIGLDYDRELKSTWTLIRRRLAYSQTEIRYGDRDVWKEGTQRTSSTSSIPNQMSQIWLFWRPSPPRSDGWTAGDGGVESVFSLYLCFTCHLQRSSVWNELLCFFWEGVLVKPQSLERLIRRLLMLFVARLSMFHFVTTTWVTTRIPKQRNICKTGYDDERKRFWQQWTPQWWEFRERATNMFLEGAWWDHWLRGFGTSNTNVSHVPMTSSIPLCFDPGFFHCTCIPSIFPCLDVYFSSAWASCTYWWSVAYRVSLHFRNLHHHHHWHHSVSRSTHFNQPTLCFLLSTSITKSHTAPFRLFPLLDFRSQHFVQPAYFHVQHKTSRQLFSQRRPSHAHHSWFCASSFSQSRGRFHFLFKHSGPNIR